MNKTLRMKMAALLAAWLGATVAFADVTYYVALGGDGTDPTSGDWAKAYNHPQTAIDAADGTTPTTVIIDDGTYACQDNTKRDSVVTIDKSNIMLKARNAGEVTIDGGTTAPASTFSVRRAITVNASLTGVAVEGLIFLNGISSSNGKKATTVLASSGAFTDCEFHGYYMQRCNIYQLGGTSSFTNCLFSPSSTALSAGDLDNYQMAISGSAQLVNCTIRDFKWWVGASGHVLSIDSKDVLLKGCVISGNTDGYPNGGTECTGTKKGVVWLNSGTLDGCTVTGNRCYGYGGGVYLGTKNAVLKDCIVWGNSATRAGNDIFVASGVTPTITGTASTDLAPDEFGNSDFDPFSEFCTVGNVMSGKAPFTVTFRNRTDDASATWDFGDNSPTETGAQPEHTYQAPGIYTVTMTLGGVQTVRTGYIVVTPAKMYVSKTGSNLVPYATPETAANHPQDAIDLAPDCAGTEIEIDDGTYTLRDPNRDVSILFIDKGGLDIHSKNGLGSVTIDAQTENQAITLRVRRQLTVGPGLSDIKLTGLKFKGGNAVQHCELVSAVCVGSGVLTDCDVEMYFFKRNAGSYLMGETFVTNCVFSQAANALKGSCQSLDQGVKVYGNVQIVNSVFRNWKMNYEKYAQYLLYVDSANALIRNCVITNAYVGQDGKSSAAAHGAVYLGAGLLENCTIADCHNWDGAGGGLTIGSSAVVRNCIIWGNTAKNGNSDIYAPDGYGNCSYSCASDLPAGANGNLNTDPKFVAGTLVPEKDSLCTGNGLVDENWMVGAVDLAGNPRLVGGTVTMGAFEPQERSAGLTGDFSISKDFGAAPFAAEFTASIKGGSGNYSYKWDFGDGTVTPFSPDDRVITHTYQAAGSYDVTLTVSDGSIETVFGPKAGMAVAVGDTCYVRPADEDANPLPPYVTWETAATNVEAAFNLHPKTVVVTNGTYFIASLSGLAMDYAVTVRSVEGPTVTKLDAGNKAAIDRDSRHYLARLSHGEAVLDGFSLIRGSQTILTASAGTVRNCIVTNQVNANRNPVCSFGGSARIKDCVFDGTGCSIVDHVTSQGHLVYASGSAVIDRCEIRNMKFDNGSSGSGATATLAPVRLAESAELRNSLVAGCDLLVFDTTPKGDTASGVIAAQGTKVHNCTVTGNRIRISYVIDKKVYVSDDVTLARSAVVGGGEFCNNLIFGNTSVAEVKSGYAGTPSCFAGNALDEGLDLPAGATGCISIDDPCFADDGSGYRITKDSPCYNKGTPVSWASRKGLATDIGGQERHCGPIDIGCWELQRPLGLMLFVR